MPAINGASILQLIRDGKANDWNALVQATKGWHQNLGKSASPTEVLYTYLERLRSAQFINFQDSPENEKGKDPFNWMKIEGPITLSRNWRKVQTALDISLTQLGELGSTSIVVEPYFGQPAKSTISADLFVLMPFQTSIKPVYDDHIVPVAKNLALSVARGDDFFTAHSIMTDIWSATCTSRDIIADCTGRNPNVFYELSRSPEIWHGLLSVIRA